MDEDLCDCGEEFDEEGICPYCDYVEVYIEDEEYFP